MQAVGIYLYVTAVGFVAAGVLSSFVQLVSGQPMRFGVEPCSLLASIGAVLLRVMAGPAILMRNAWRGLTIQSRPKVWFGISAAIAAVWSLFSGAVLLDLIFNLPRCPPLKKESRPLARPAPVKARLGRGWVGDGHRALSCPQAWG